MINTYLAVYKVSINVIRYANKSSWYRHTITDISFSFLCSSKQGFFCLFVFFFCKIDLKSQGECLLKEDTE